MSVLLVPHDLDDCTTSKPHLVIKDISSRPLWQAMASFWQDLSRATETTHIINDPDQYMLQTSSIETASAAASCALLPVFSDPSTWMWRIIPIYSLATNYWHRHAGKHNSHESSFIRTSLHVLRQRAFNSLLVDSLWQPAPVVIGLQSERADGCRQ